MPISEPLFPSSACRALPESIGIYTRRSHLHAKTTTSCRLAKPVRSYDRNSLLHIQRRATHAQSQCSRCTYIENRTCPTVRWYSSEAHALSTTDILLYAMMVRPPLSLSLSLSLSLFLSFSLARSLARTPFNVLKTCCFSLSLARQYLPCI